VAEQAAVDVVGITESEWSSWPSGRPPWRSTWLWWPSNEVLVTVVVDEQEGVEVVDGVAMTEHAVEVVDVIAIVV